ncbi:MAG: ribonuclease HIII [Candidatus Cloacimonetes bacterium]|nr:ribonuclease HIII [Candidatus Cloacimonadota bacterium]
MHKEIEHYLASLYPSLNNAGITILEQREIAYGVQMRLVQDIQKATLNVYYSDKKGVSAVAMGAKDSALYGFISKLANPVQMPVNESTGFHSWTSWIGSDECGKGDYFGAPVVCAFSYDDSLAASFKTLGIKDSKLLKDPQIVTVAKALYQNYPKRIACIVLKPAKYNELIYSFKQKNRNLNDLLAWLHSTNIQNLLKTQPDVQGILVDQFSPSQKVRLALKSKEVTIPCIERTGAERDYAVAAASIIARYQFIESIASLSRFYKIEFPKGANAKVIKVAVEFAKLYGMSRLGEVAKLHFKTTLQVQERFTK